MDEYLAQVTNWLLSASAQVAKEYIQLPVADQEEPEYRERVYCYELYHRWRSHWPAGFRFSLSGEVDKAGHPLIRCASKPDFLVHVPGKMRNLLVVEVKPWNAKKCKMVEDLEKLTRFRRELDVKNGGLGNYHAAYFWVYGAKVEDWPELRAGIRTQLGDKRVVDLSLITCFVHERADKQAEQVDW